jgi:hypothetical protein
MDQTVLSHLGHVSIMDKETIRCNFQTSCSLHRPVAKRIPNGQPFRAVCEVFNIPLTAQMHPMFFHYWGMIKK